MQASLRIARSAAPLRRSARCLATTANPAHVSSSSTASSTVHSSPSIIPLSNVEAQWERMTSDEQLLVHQQLEQLQKKDWKELSIDEKKAAYYVAFGPHGPRAPVNPPGTTLKIILGTGGLIAAAGALYLTIRMNAPAPPSTLTKEWQEASNELALAAKMDPITGISSEGYKGKGFVQSK